jgi:hypothetical protein
VILVLLCQIDEFPNDSGVITFEGIVQIARIRYAAFRCWITPPRHGYGGW